MRDGQGLYRPLPFVSAPAGFGKRSCVWEWLRSDTLTSKWRAKEHGIRARRASRHHTPCDLNSTIAALWISISRVTSSSVCAALARQAGLPVVLKLRSPDIVHKSDIGGLLLNIHNAEEAASGYDTLLRRVHEAEPEAAVTGVLVQEMIAAGQEVIVGVTRDPQFGPVLCLAVAALKWKRSKTSPLPWRQ